MDVKGVFLLSQLTSSGSCNSLEVSLFTSPHTHSTSFHKIFEAEIINAATD